MSEFERDIALLLRAENRDPFRLLGPHIVEEAEEKEARSSRLLSPSQRCECRAEGVP